MGFRFYKRIRLLPGITLNIGGKGASVSFGTKGFKYTIGKTGQHITFGIPGTGIFYTKKISKNQKANRKELLISKKENPVELESISLNIKIQNNLLTGILAYNQNNLEEAIKSLKKDTSLESRLVLAVIYFKQKKYDEAKDLLESIINHPNREELGKKFTELNLIPSIKFDLTKEILIHIELNLITAMLILTEIYQIKGEFGLAIKTIQKAYSIYPENLFLLSYIEILYEYYNKTKINNLLETIHSLTENIELKSLLDACILYYRLLALISSNQIEEAKTLYNQLISNSDLLTKELMKAIQEIKNIN
ncbi:MAG: DUF4236 domain-containing protein [Leptonema sp. (in: bacteria)]